MKETFDGNFHQFYGNLWLSNYQYEILKKNNIDIHKYSSINELLFSLEEILNLHDNDELEQVSLELSEFNYYNNTSK